MKLCTRCLVLQPLSSFSVKKRSKDGLRHTCRVCNKIDYAAWRAANPEKSKAACASYRQANPEKVKAAAAIYYAANTEERKAYNAAWRKANPDKLHSWDASWCAAWRAANPDYVRLWNHNRRVSIRISGNVLSQNLVAKLFKLQRGLCVCCNKPLGDDYHLDHIMPFALGGINVDSNTQLLRQRCNNQKGAKDPIDFMQSRGFLL